LIVLVLDWTKSDLTNSKYTKKSPTSSNPALSIFLGFEIIKASSSTIFPYLMKTNPWFAWDVLVEFGNTCENTIGAYTRGNHVQLSVAQ